MCVCTYVYYILVCMYLCRRVYVYMYVCLCIYCVTGVSRETKSFLN